MVQNTVHFIFGHTSPYHLISTVSVKNWLLPIVVFKVCEKPLLLLIVKFRGNHFGHQIVHIICKPGNFPLVFNSEEFLVWKFVIHRNIISGPFQSRKVAATRFSVHFLSLISTSNSCSRRTHRINRGFASFLVIKYLMAE